jgi:two-component system, chemotaxis family, sensor kinase Cph1
LDAGHFSCRPQACKIQQVIQDSVNSMRPIAHQKSINIRMESNVDVDVMCDPERIKQVACNLIGNAVKFSLPKSEILACVSMSGEGVLVSIKDWGAGIPTDDLPQIFNRYYHGKSKGAGSGLGLAISKGIIEAHHGRIWAESRVDVGSTFFFTIPNVLRDTAEKRDNSAKA